MNAPRLEDAVDKRDNSTFKFCSHAPRRSGFHLCTILCCLYCKTANTFRPVLGSSAAWVEYIEVKFFLLCPIVANLNSRVNVSARFNVNALPTPTSSFLCFQCLQVCILTLSFIQQTIHNSL